MGDNYIDTFRNIAIVIVAGVLIAIPVINMQRTSIRENVTDNAEVQVSQATAKINSFLLKPMTIVNDMAVFVSSHDIEKEEAQDAFEAAITGDSSLYSLYFADTVPMREGGILYSNDKWEPGADYDKASREWYARGITSANPIVTEPYIDADSKQPVTTIARSVQKDGSPYGGIAIDILLGDLTQLISDTRLSKSGQSFILDANGNYLTNEDAKKILSSNFYADFPATAEFRNQISAGHSFVNLYVAGGMYFMAQKISDVTGWTFVSVGPSGEFAAQLKGSVSLILILFLAVLLLSVVAAFALASPIIRPIISVDKAVNKIASEDADLTQRVELSTNDEIGSLVGGFNKFTEKLQHIISDIKGSKRLLSSAGEELDVSMQDTSASITEIIANIHSVHGQISRQGESVSQTVGAVNEIASNIDSLERMIEKQSQGVEQASAAVEEMSQFQKY